MKKINKRKLMVKIVAILALIALIGASVLPFLAF